ncbi:MAG TPA: zinc-ribbon domain-containing protein [Microlunatus sp.]
MIAIDLICEACGEPNPPGTEFCRNCNEFLAWDKAPADTQPPASGTGTTSTVPVIPVVEQTVPISQQQTTSVPVPVDQTYAEQPYVDQPHPDQGYVDQTSVDQSYVDQTYPDQAYVEQAYTEIACPTCGTVNPPTRRFCSHCGYSFVAAYGSDPYVDWSAWTPQAMAARDREAARAYRRSLPPLYRWRRVIIAVIVFALFIGLGAVARLGPVALAKDGWHRLSKKYVTVSGVQVMVNPTTASAPDSNPQSLVDSTKQEWTMVWAPTGESPSCGAAPGTGTLMFTFPATRVRQVIIWPGLDADNPQRDLQPQPRVIGIGFPDGSCYPATVGNGAAAVHTSVDSGEPVTQLRLGIASTYPASPDLKPLISLTEVTIRAFPQ